MNCLASLESWRLLGTESGAAALLYLDQLNSEIQLFSRHLVVGVKGNRGVVLCGYFYREGLAVLIGQIDLLACLQVLGAGKPGDFKGEDSVGVRHAVGLLRHQMDVHNLSRLHIGHSRVKSLNHHARSADKFQGLPAVVGRIKLRPVVEGASVMGAAGFSDIASGNGMVGAAAVLPKC